MLFNSIKNVHVWVSSLRISSKLVIELINFKLKTIKCLSIIIHYVQQTLLSSFFYGHFSIVVGNESTAKYYDVEKNKQ